MFDETNELPSSSCSQPVDHGHSLWAVKTSSRESGGVVGLGPLSIMLSGLSTKR